MRSFAAVAHACAPGEPTAASYTWDFKAEADQIFKEVQADARDAMDHADTLETYIDDPYLDWYAHAEQLDDLKQDVNDIGARLCRLETIRRAVAPWQQHVIDNIAITERLMADNAQDAIIYGNAHRDTLWTGTYGENLTNLASEAASMKRVAGDAAEYASVANQYRDLKQEVGE